MPLGFLLLPAELAGAAAQVGDEMIKLAEVACREIEGIFDCFGKGEVAGNGEDAVAVAAALTQLIVGAVEIVGVAAGQDDPGAFVEERGCDAAADATGGAGDEADLVGEMKIHVAKDAGLR